MSAGIGGRRLGGLATNHETGTRHDAVLVGLDHPRVHRFAVAEVVGVDDQVSHRPSSPRSFSRTVSARKYSAAMSFAARLCRPGSASIASIAATAWSSVANEKR